MAFVRATDLCLKYPVFTAATRSLKNNVLSHLTGGRIAAKSFHHMEIIAIDRVTFRFDPGDRVALIGQNGSGKTTLLRLIAGIYHPVSGCAEVDGTVATLLDTSFGLDAKSTGYENIFLRGLLLGVSRIACATKSMISPNLPNSANFWICRCVLIRWA